MKKSKPKSKHKGGRIARCCPGCAQPIAGRKIILCPGCQKVFDIGRKFQGMGFEIVHPFKEYPVPDMHGGFSDFTVISEPLLKFTNLHGNPKAVGIGPIWYARIDAHHPLHDFFEAQFKDHSS